MNTVLGASGQVGSAVVDNLLKNRQPVRGVIRNKKKAARLKKAGAAVAVADIHDESALTASFRDATAVLVLTPETGEEPDLMKDTRAVLQNYRKAVEKSSARKIVGLSSVGAQHEKGTGNLMMSYMLEHAFEGLPVKQIFVRPSYYFSNWLEYVDTVKADGVLPTFFPVDLSIPMISPMDVAEIIARVMMENKNEDLQTVYELEGPAWYSSIDVADTFSEILGIKVVTKQIARSEWEKTLKPLGFSKDGIENFIEMTDAVISGKALPEKTNTVSIKGKTSLLQYMKNELADM
jgi:uncharacterized protein YbjT (DUF2867 family)